MEYHYFFYLTHSSHVQAHSSASPFSTLDLFIAYGPDVHGARRLCQHAGVPGLHNPGGVSRAMGECEGRQESNVKLRALWFASEQGFLVRNLSA
jgi:hypothetical protein